MADDTLTAPRRAAPSGRTRALLHRVSPDSTSHVLPTGRIRLGREPGAPGLVVADPRASRVHAELEVGADSARITDLDSHNGTAVNGVAVRSTALADGDVIRCGDALFVLRWEPPDVDDPPVPGLLGTSVAVRRLRAELARFAPTAAAIWLAGESGTGKSAAAAALHALSGRRGPLHRLNGGAVPAGTADSALFGHVAGAFTDARCDHPGAFRSAHRGTLFLDEVTLLTAADQARLLLAVERREVTPVGGRATPVDVRIVSASNEPAEEAIAVGRFRLDLHARLAEVVIDVPPLRARREDVLPLFRNAAGADRPLTADLAERLLLWSWPLNVRELEQAAREALVRAAPGATLDLEHLGNRRMALPGPPAAAPVAAGPPDREALEALLRRCAGNVSEAARVTGRATKQVYRWCAKHGLDPASYR